MPGLSLCAHAWLHIRQLAELDLRQTLDSHLAIGNTIISLLQVRKSRLRKVGFTCLEITQVEGAGERIQIQVRMTLRAHSRALVERVLAQNTPASFRFCNGTTVHVCRDGSHSFLITLLEAKV